MGMPQSESEALSGDERQEFLEDVLRYGGYDDYEGLYPSYTQAPRSWGHLINEIPITDRDEIMLDGTTVVGWRGFEDYIREEWSSEGNTIAHKAEWIRGHLNSVGSDYVYRMWKRYKWFVDVRMPSGFGDRDKAGDYTDMREYLWVLKKLDLVRVEEKVENAVEGRIDRSYYTVVSENSGDEAWESPKSALYG